MRRNLDKKLDDTAPPLRAMEEDIDPEKEIPARMIRELTDDAQMRSSSGKDSFDMWGNGTQFGMWEILDVGRARLMKAARDVQESLMGEPEDAKDGEEQHNNGGGTEKGVDGDTVRASPTSELKVSDQLAAFARETGQESEDLRHLLTTRPPEQEPEDTSEDKTNDESLNGNPSLPRYLINQRDQSEDDSADTETETPTFFKKLEGEKDKARAGMNNESAVLPRTTHKEEEEKEEMNAVESGKSNYIIKREEDEEEGTTTSTISARCTLLAPAVAGTESEEEESFKITEDASRGSSSVPGFMGGKASRTPQSSSRIPSASTGVFSPGTHVGSESQQGRRDTGAPHPFGAGDSGNVGTARVGEGEGAPQQHPSGDEVPPHNGASKKHVVGGVGDEETQWHHGQQDEIMCSTESRKEDEGLERTNKDGMTNKDGNESSDQGNWSRNVMKTYPMMSVAEMRERKTVQAVMGYVGDLISGVGDEVKRVVDQAKKEREKRKNEKESDSIREEEEEEGKGG